MKLRTLASDESLSSTSFLHFLNAAKHVAVRPPALISSSFPFNHSLSPCSNDASAREVVVDRRWSCESVTERDEFVGRMRAVSRFPQYLDHGVSHTQPKEGGEAHLMHAMFTGAEAVA